MAFIFDITIKAKTDEYREEALETFRNVCRLTTRYPGATSYICFRPDPQQNPNTIRIIEVYGNEAAFINSHVSPEFKSTIGNALASERFEDIDMAVYIDPGADLPELRAYFGENETPVECLAGISKGYIRRPDAVFKSVKYAVVLLARLQTDQPDAVLEKLDGFVNSAHAEVTNLAIVAKPAEDGKPGVVNIVEVVSSNAGLVKHIGAMDCKAAIKEASELCQQTDYIVYGDLLDAAKKELSEVLQGLKAQPKVGAGWIIHRDADFDAK